VQFLSLKYVKIIALSLTPTGILGMKEERGGMGSEGRGKGWRGREGIVFTNFSFHFLACLTGLQKLFSKKSPTQFVL